ncbi:hypothetical protein CVT25_000942 [Psilocybe cyanescens]|uniref:Uncharacterized protein n=1 Tax=Psilocybe cyanescens TaxID=93625 RepID=A0A409X8K6_PSICY|nr:hypothetical protein CVT25_000942 [Psilocybe cyanescens]
MAGIVFEIGGFVQQFQGNAADPCERHRAGVIAASQQEKNTNRKDRSCDLAHSLQDISERVRETLETAQGLLPSDDVNILIWKKAISEKSSQTISDAMGSLRSFAFPLTKLDSEVSIPELFYRRFLMRKLELQAQGVLASIKEAISSVSKLKISLSTYDNLAKSGTITKSQASQARQKVLSEYPSVEIQPPNLPSNQTIFEELRQRDIATKVYMDEDPSLESTEKWLTTI